MFDEFDPFNHSDNETDIFHDDGGQHDDNQYHDDGSHHLAEQETPDFDDGIVAGHPVDNQEDLGGLAPSDHELHQLDNLDEDSILPDHSQHHQDISFGSSETISCSDCSGGCAAYCASLYR
ncbi:MAG TPA: hypothetical protein VHY08_05255 [Bacillota bacterium]|nr:hypothetical protein [Bacillota bacterium]